MVSLPVRFPQENPVSISYKDWGEVKLKQWEKKAQEVSGNVFHDSDSSLLIPIAHDLASQYLPEELRQQISQINLPDGLTHLHLKGLPQDPYLPASPVDGNRPIGKRTFVSELVLLGIISHALESEVFAYQEQKQGDLVQNVVPIQGLEKTQSNASVGNFGWHSDDASFKRPYRAEGIALFCLRNQSKTVTYFAEVDDIIKALHPIDLQVLREPRFRVRTPESFKLYGGKIVSSEPRAIITDGEAGAEIALATYNVVPVDDEDEEALDALYALKLALRTPVAKSFVLQQGEVLIISNVRGVHARGPIFGGDRWLQRCYFRKDLTELHKVTNSSHDCRVFGSEDLFLL
ncbi:TauD/TfdA family dioxygenase [Geminocystis sp. NIES-3709]|uniref:TauD/TfdA family dioxygenase n=1 Tax=Geminocystis sp. NIES-3709 TaxID=1617448 RepID=UPI0005FC8267|nr:TauD/TfdA family dioxygenase [Geminocystis sp. NIES-3709]BAQ66951.1 putative oxygenase [Geminocystis sp. NIES-3709]